MGCFDGWRGAGKKGIGRFMMIGNRKLSTRCAAVASAIVSIGALSAAHAADARVQPSSKPTASQLINSWVALEQQIPRDLHSYQMDGSAVNLTFTGASAPIGVGPSKWQSINSGNQLKWQAGENGYRHVLSADARQISAYTLAPDGKITGIKCRRDAEPVAKYIQNLDSLQRIFRVEDLLTCPMAACSTSARSLGKPLSAYYKQHASDAVIVGSAAVGNWMAWHIHMNHTPGRKGLAIPADVWFAQIAGRYVPVQFMLTEPGNTGRTTITLTGGQSIGTSWVPTSYVIANSCPGKLQNGQVGWAMIWPQQKFQLRISKVNAKSGLGIL